MSLPHLPAVPAPPMPPQDDEEEPQHQQSPGVLAPTIDAVEASLEAVDLTVQSAWCFDSMPDLDCSSFDCGGFDCDPGCA